MKLKKYFFFGEDKPPVFYRTGTSDETVINQILVNQGDYRFLAPNIHFDPLNIYDIGANIGAATLALATVYPKATIYAFEPEPDNFAILKMNCDPYQNIKCMNIGLGAGAGRMDLFKSEDPTNLGGFSMYIDGGRGHVEAEIVSVRQIVEAYGVPDVIKIDCEGAEGEILRNFPGIEKVSWIAGEMHGMDADYLMLHLLSTHFKLELARNFDDKVWHFHAFNKATWDLCRKLNSENGLAVVPTD